MTIAEFKLMPETRNVYFGVNCYDHVCISKSINCWNLYIEKQTPNGVNHYSAHNTYDEAVREAEMLTSWETSFGNVDEDRAYEDDWAKRVKRSGVKI